MASPAIEPGLLALAHDVARKFTKTTGRLFISMPQTIKLP